MRARPGNTGQNSQEVASILAKLLDVSLTDVCLRHRSHQTHTLQDWARSKLANQPAAPADSHSSPGYEAHLAGAKHLLHIEKQVSHLALTLDLHPSISLSNWSLANFLAWPGPIATCQATLPSWWASRFSIPRYPASPQTHSSSPYSRGPVMAPGHARWQRWWPGSAPDHFDHPFP